jgi:hypothetical protein
MCPRCGQTGYAAVQEESVAFAARGVYRGEAALKCFVCGSGFVVDGANTEPIPVDRWSEIEARYDREHRTAAQRAVRS